MHIMHLSVSMMTMSNKWLQAFFYSYLFTSQRKNGLGFIITSSLLKHANYKHYVYFSVSITPTSFRHTDHPY